MKRTPDCQARLGLCDPRIPSLVAHNWFSSPCIISRRSPAVDTVPLMLRKAPGVPYAQVVASLDRECLGGRMLGRRRITGTEEARGTDVVQRQSQAIAVRFGLARGSSRRSCAAETLRWWKRSWAALLIWHDIDGWCRPTTPGTLSNCAKSHEESPNNGEQSPCSCRGLPTPSVFRKISASW